MVAETYRKVGIGVAQGVEQFSGKATSPDRAADAIIHALFSPNPRIRYFVGNDAKIFSTIQALTTDKVMDAILRKTFKQ